MSYGYVRNATSLKLRHNQVIASGIAAVIATMVVALVVNHIYGLLPWTALYIMAGALASGMIAIVVGMVMGRRHEKRLAWPK